ncbi:MAG: Uma2 family endonuclease [Selenomonadaceae bacterium]|nr:Uma2 family endonuclease [Selenomonadaceae bacterium]
MATEIINERLLYPSYEIIGGEKIMAPAANITHGSIIGRIYSMFVNYFMANKNGYVFGENTDIHFPDGNIFKPDLSVVLKPNEQILDWRGNIYGSPDMVVEVLSKSTRRKDLTVKKDIYEANGVREYWIIDPWAKGVDVCLLHDGKYFFSDEYILFDEKDLALLNDEERATVKTEIPVSIVDGLSIPLEFVFSWGY